MALKTVSRKYLRFLQNGYQSRGAAYKSKPLDRCECGDLEAYSYKCEICRWVDNNPIIKISKVK